VKTFRSERDHEGGHALQSKNRALAADGAFEDRRPAAAALAGSGTMMNASARAVQMAALAQRIDAGPHAVAQRRRLQGLGHQGAARAPLQARTAAPLQLEGESANGQTGATPSAAEAQAADQVTLPEPEEGQRKAGAKEQENTQPTPSAGALPADAEKKQQVEDKAALVDAQIDAILAAATDSASIELQLLALQKQYQLKNIKLVDAGKPQARVRYEINPTYEKHVVGQGEIAYRMLGTGDGAFRTNVLFVPGSVAVNGVSDTVGKEIIANPLSQDHQAGSEPADAAQKNLMAQLPNAGVKKIANPNKYIKGHLLNGDLGGPGNAINLYPITADANAKHLAFVEKFVKSSVLAGYVVYYHVRVTNEAIQNTNELNADLEFDFFRYDVNGKPVQNSRHKGSVQSRYAQVGAAPYTIEDEFEQVDGEKEYDKLNKGKNTPKAQPLGDEAESHEAGYKLAHGGSTGITEADENEDVALPTVYGGGAKTLFMYGVSGASGYGAVSSNAIGSFNGRFVIAAQTAEAEHAKGWHWVTLQKADNEDIEIGNSWLMKSAWLNKGYLIDDGTPFKRPLNIAHSPEGGNQNEIETFWGGAYFKTSSLSKQEWLQVQISHSLDGKLENGAVGWMKSAWLNKEA
jgi:hypothetical protein